VFADPQVQHLGMQRILHHPERGDVPLVDSAVRLTTMPHGTDVPPPILGEHTAALLQELGYDAAAAERLRAAGAS
jgi:crotonobetainyl-CoA:carnitine CoA-transferase CaiB-like acyl-CoA transferase